ncbi:MAG: hypothetical protein RIE73_01125 [Coleofasciculus sp. C1-SOL-03]|jgi:hypothetical protein
MQAGRPYTRIKGDSLPGAIAPVFFRKSDRLLNKPIFNRQSFKFRKV